MGAFVMDRPLESLDIGGWENFAQDRMEGDVDPHVESEMDGVVACALWLASQKDRAAAIVVDFATEVSKGVSEDYPNGAFHVFGAVAISENGRLIVRYRCEPFIHGEGCDCAAERMAFMLAGPACEGVSLKGFLYHFRTNNQGRTQDAEAIERLREWVLQEPDHPILAALKAECDLDSAIERRDVRRGAGPGGL